jgi:hypothetical protein
LLADRSTLTNLAFENGQDKIAVMLLRPLPMGDRDLCAFFLSSLQVAVLMRLKFATEAMEEGEFGSGHYMETCVNIITSVDANIREEKAVSPSMDLCLGFKISHSL